MPATLSARAFLWIGVALLAAGALSQLALDIVFRTAGASSVENILDSQWYTVLGVIRAVLVPLGPLMFAAFFVAGAIERRSTAQAAAQAGAPAAPPPRFGAGWVFGTGVVLTLFGVLVSSSLDGWLIDLNAQGRTSLALDALNLVVVPLRALLFPVGLALLPASALMKKLELPHSVDTEASAPTSGQLPR